jgi:NAD(P)-dependent dehydrogenase (short-subunit alcohol dehydrogenase family)
MARRNGSDRWTAEQVPSLAGRSAVVTGATSGIGVETARVLALRGATVLLACRQVSRAERVADAIRAEAIRAGSSQSGDHQVSVRVVPLDLADMASVRAAAAEIGASCPRLDLLINNAGVMSPPYQRTADGFELTFAVNHLGPFALTGLLLDRLLAAPGARVVTVSSVAHRYGTMHFDDLNFEGGYEADPAYGQSKLANLLFTYELQERLATAGAQLSALAAHPGVVRTELWRTSSGLERVLVSPRLRLLTGWAVQDSEQGALPTLRAATDPAAQGGEYYGPGGYKEFTGYPVLVQSSDRSHELSAQRRLWEISEQLTGVTYPLPAAAGQPG